MPNVIMSDSMFGGQVYIEVLSQNINAARNTQLCFPYDGRWLRSLITGKITGMNFG